MALVSPLDVCGGPLGCVSTLDGEPSRRPLVACAPRNPAGSKGGIASVSVEDSSCPIMGESRPSHSIESPSLSFGGFRPSYFVYLQTLLSSGAEQIQQSFPCTLISYSLSEASRDHHLPDFPIDQSAII